MSASSVRSVFLLAQNGRRRTVRNWVVASHYLVANDCSTNCAIIDGQIGRCWWDRTEETEDGQVTKREWFEGRAKVVFDEEPFDGLGARWIIIYEEEETDEGTVYKFVYNKEEGSMFVDVLPGGMR